MVCSPFQIAVADPVLKDLGQRLAATRWPDTLPNTDWTYGTELTYLQTLVGYWRDVFDWRAQERFLNTLPQFTTQIEGNHLHFVYVKGTGSQPVPLLISHGWPGSFFEMHKVIGPLTDPGSHGGDPADAFDVVVPSLPGFGFSGPTKAAGFDVGRIAEVFVALMEGLGYRRFFAQGGDWGSYITTMLGRKWASRTTAIHLNTLPALLLRSAASAEEKVWLDERALAKRDEGGYSQIQGTRPQTLAYALNDSPVGLAAWIIEKFRAWSDCNGDVESVFTRDELLTNVMIYWVTQTANSSARLYYETMHGDAEAFAGPVAAPLGLAVFPAEGGPYRPLVERIYNLQRWTEMAAGGHFAALEQPGLLVEDIRAFFRPFREHFR